LNFIKLSSLILMSVILSQTVTMASESFHMVVIGDSIAWGAGLEENQKYYSLIHDWIAQEKNIPSGSIDLQVLAHTGAVLCTENYDPVHNPDLSSGNPSISKQADMISNPGDVDLILVSGGINDIGVDNIINLDHLTSFTGTNIVKPAAFVGNTLVGQVTGSPITPELTRSVEDLQGASSGLEYPMRVLLNRLLKECPNAKIVVTGYYPIVSDDSMGLSDTVLALFPPTKYVEDYKHLDEPERRKQLVDKSNAFYGGSTISLNAAVNDAKSDSGSDRVAFARVVFKPENSYGASQTWLWRITKGPNGATIDDNRFNARQSLLNDLGWACYCKDCSLEVTSSEKVDCNVYWKNKFAAVGHPNERGAIEYKDKIIEAITKTWPDWLKKQDNTNSPINTAPSPINPINRLPDVSQLEKSLSGLIPMSIDISHNSSPALYIVCIVLALIIGVGLIRRSLWDFIMNAISGLVVIYLSSMYLGIGIAITIPTLLICAIGGFPGAIILIVLKYYYGITF